MAVQIFDDFQINYKKVARWQFRQRRSLLQLSLETERSKIFSLVKPEGKSPLVHLEEHETNLVLAVSSDGTELQLEKPVPQGNVSLTVGEWDIPLLAADSCVIQTDGELLITTRHRS